MALYFGNTKINGVSVVAASNSDSASPTLQAKTAIPTEADQTITADSGYDGLSSVEVGAISSTYVGSGVTRQATTTITPTTSSQIAVASGVYTTGAVTVSAVPTETKSITSNGTYAPTSGNFFSSVTVNVEGDSFSTQAKSVTPSVTAQTVTPDSGYDGLSSVTINAIPTSYGTPDFFVTYPLYGLLINNISGDSISQSGAITWNSSEGSLIIPNSMSFDDPTDYTYRLTVDDGVFYCWDPSITVSSSRTEISGHLYVTTIDEGILVYHNDAEINFTLSVDLTSGNTSYLTINDEGMGAITDTDTPIIFEAMSGGLIYATTALDEATCRIAPQEPVTITPSETQQTVGSADKYLLGPITISAISSSYVGSGVDRNDSTDLIVSGATVTAAAGYYSTSASASIANGSATTPATSITANPTISINSSGLITASASASQSVTPTVSAGYVSSGTAGTIVVSGSSTEQLATQEATTITPTESAQVAVAANTYTLGAVSVAAISDTYVGSAIDQNDSTDLTVSGATVTAPAGYYESAASATVASGSATTPATTITANPTISVNASGLITATASASQNVTPTVSAGYVSTGTAGTVTVSGSDTSQLTTLATTTYNTSTTDQTIASGRYLTGTQTIKAVTVSGLSASNILSGVTVKVGDANDDDRIASVTGTVVIQHYYTSSSAPTSSDGNDGDIWLQT